MTKVRARKFLALTSLAAVLVIAAAAHSAHAAKRPDLAQGSSRLGKGHKNFFLRILGFEPATRFYLTPVAGAEDTYWGVLLDYAPAPQVGPKYLAAHIGCGGLNKVIGYLNHIARRISVYKVKPSDETGNLWEMRRVKVVDTQVLEDAAATPMTLKLKTEIRTHDPIGGAKIYQANEKGKLKEKYGFPDSGGLHGTLVSQYDLTAAVYRLARLNSTWHHDWLTGPYLAAYHKEDDVVLNLGSDTASFVSDSAFDGTDPEKRAKIFTNAKSAALRGEYNVANSAPEAGMFTLSPKGEGQVNPSDVVGRIGLFLDIFDASDALGQRVVELAFINPADPKDFLMYYTGGTAKKECQEDN